MTLLLLAALAALTIGTETAPAPLTAVPFEKVAIEDVFWSPRIETNRRATVVANLDKCRDTFRIRNFAVAGGLARGRHEGRLYNDSDLYKVIEGVAYTLANAPDEALEARADAIIEQIAAAQGEDGYLNTYIQLVKPGKRWLHVRGWHELYCAGHLIEAAIAYERATGKRELLDVAIRFADCIDREFGPGKRLDPPGHQELELALFKLARATGEERYATLATFFLGQRGSEEGRTLFGEYCQDHLPVRAQHEAVGHSVRATYQYCAMADAAAESGDAQLIEALEALWTDVVTRKMYLTGGIGSSASNEGFTRPYDLPNDSAYAETCASIGMALWNQRMFLLTRRARYADVVERQLYNNIPSGVSLSGDRFFYVNPLASRGDHHRVPWFDCSCCPTNIVRTIPAVGERVYAHDGENVWVSQYVGSETSIDLEGGLLHLSQETRYPWDGAVTIRLKPGQRADFTLHLRLPGWMTEPASVRVNDEPAVEARPLAGEAGWHSLRRTWKFVDTVRIELPMPAHWVAPDPKVAANRDRVALQRGPLVYCLEGTDNGGRVRDLVVDPQTEIESVWRPELLGGATILRGEARRIRLADCFLVAEDISFEAVPYHLWDNREAGEMVVWLPTSDNMAELPGDGHKAAQGDLFLRASHCWRGDTLLALNDGVLPENSDDPDIPRLTFWDHRGTAEWVQAEFRGGAKRRVDGVRVYWFDDTGRGGCRLPASWKLEWRDGEDWKPVALAPGSRFGTALDAFNDVAFEAVETDALQLLVQLEKNWSGGILEWEIAAAE